MDISYRQVMERLDGEFVGGELLVRLGRKKVSVGRKKHGAFVFSPAGKEIAQKVLDDTIDELIAELNPTKEAVMSENSDKPVRKAKARRWNAKAKDK